MTEFVFVKPAEGARVRQPDRNSNVMPAEGTIVPRTVYYERLIMTGEIVVDEAKSAELSPEERKRRQEEAKAEAEKPVDRGEKIGGFMPPRGDEVALQDPVEKPQPPAPQNRRR
jgi:hypothetical protein